MTANYRKKLKKEGGKKTMQIKQVVYFAQRGYNTYQ